MKHLSILFFLLILPFAVSSQTQVKGSLTGYLYPIIDNMPGRDGGEYAVPGAEDLARWEELTGLLLERRFAAADSVASLTGYVLVELTDNEKTYMILRRKESSSHYWGTYVFWVGPYSLKSAAAAARLALQAPHPKYDTNTGREAAYVMSHTGSYFLFLAGTHRCNSAYASSCSGTTTACSTTAQSYRISDMAHNVNTVFETVTETLAEQCPDMVFLQLHGFAQRDDDPYVIMSNGTRLTPASSDWVVMLRDALEAVDPVLDFRVAHIDTDWTRLIAFTNVQGRYLNGSADICSEDADTVSGRFVHVEQEKSRLRADSTGWEKMARAVHRVFDGAADVHDHSFMGTVQVSPNPFTDRTVIRIGSEGQPPFDLFLFSVDGRQVRELRNIRERGVVLSREDLTPGLYFLVVRDRGGRRYAGKVEVR